MSEKWTRSVGQLLIIQQYLSISYHCQCMHDALAASCIHCEDMTAGLS